MQESSNGRVNSFKSIAHPSHLFHVGLCLFLLAAAFDPTAQSALGAGAIWTQNPISISGRARHVMAYDSSRAVTVLFGGTTGGFETQEWDGNAWTVRSSTGPSARTDSAMIYDSTRGVMVLFGGLLSNGTTRSNETWEWNGTTWSLRTTSGPSARNAHAMAYDAARGVTVLFSGQTGTSTQSNETWEWDGTAWTLRASSGPLPRNNHAMTYDAVRHFVVLFGGATSTVTGQGYNSETWEWDGTLWTQRIVSGPVARKQHAMIYDSTNSRTVLFGGSSGINPTTHLADVWTWDGTAWTQDSSTDALPVFEHAMAFDSARNRIVSFGGFIDQTPPSLNGSDSNGATHEWSAGAWTRIAEGSVPAFSGPLIAYDTLRSETVAFVGQTWRWDGSDWTFADSAEIPNPSGGAMAFDIQNGEAVIFGADNPYTWTWDGTDWTFHETTQPSVRSGNAMTYDSLHHVAVMFGGFVTFPGSPHTVNETWQWGGAGWGGPNTTGPIARQRSSLAFDSARGVVVLFGGSNGSSIFYGDTWEWDGTAWTQRSSTGPAARNRTALAYDAVRGVTVLFGGANAGGDLSDTWEWDGTSWSQRLISGPLSRSAHAMTYDSDRSRVILMGGLHDGSATNETWELVPCATGDVNADAQVTPADVPDFVDVLLDPSSATPEQLCAADMDGSGGVDGHDIALFDQAVLAGP
jgi:hypothetical protein